MSINQNPFAGVEGEYERRMRELREGASQPSQPATQPSTGQKPAEAPRTEVTERPVDRPAPKDEPVVAEPAAKQAQQEGPAQRPTSSSEGPRQEVAPERTQQAEPKPEPKTEPEPQDHSQPIVSGALSRQRARGEFRIKPATSSAIKPVPTSLIDVLRERLTGTAAAGYSQDRLVVGYLVATLGLPADELDEKTQEIAAEFKRADPMLTMMAQFESALNKQSLTLERMNDAAQSTRATADVTELGVAYLLAERTGTLDTSHVTVDKMDMIQRKVIAARDRAREQLRRRSAEEKVTKGRPFR